MSLTDIIICGAGAVCAVVFLFSRRAKDYLKSMVLGLGALLVVNAASVFTGAAVRVTAGTVGSAVFFGVPGVIMSLVMNLM